MGCWAVGEEENERGGGEAHDTKGSPGLPAAKVYIAFQQDAFDTVASSVTGVGTVSDTPHGWLKIRISNDKVGTKR
jgi:hypothetical protein